MMNRNMNDHNMTTNDPIINEAYYIVTEGGSFPGIGLSYLFDLLRKH